MYIPFEKIGKIVAFFCNKNTKDKVLNYFLELKTVQNCKYIENNSKKVLKKLKKEKNKRKLRVAFLCNDETKWKCESLFKLLEKSEYFSPFILVTKSDAPKNSSKQMNLKEVLDIYNFFIQKGFKTYFAYDISKDKFIPIKKFKPDLIFYQQPWYNQTQQGPVVSSKFALTYYVPYYITNVSSPMEYDLRFHRYIHCYYVLNEIIRDFYSSKMKNKGKNLKVVGHTQLDYYLTNKSATNCKNYVIYAPHWSINYPQENYATFEWNGREILSFAKQHPEINWVYKPHPILKHRLLTQNVMTEDEIENYWSEWKKIALVYEGGDYMELFTNSKAMISDCGSFLTEYLPVNNPLIRLVSKDAYPYNPSAKIVVSAYYSASNLQELYELLDKVIIKNIDTMREKRKEVIEKLCLNSNNAALNILNDLKNELDIE